MNHDFDPLAELLTGTRSPSAPAAPSPVAFEIPICLDTLAHPLPNEDAAATISRAALAVAPPPRSMGPNAPAARPVRTPDPARQPLPPAPPYPFDGTNHLATAAIAVLVVPAAGRSQSRTAAAVLLVGEFETRHQRPASLPDLLTWWWLAARRCADVATLLGRPGLSPNALRLRALRPTADDFADALRIPHARRRRLYEQAGVPMPPPPGPGKRGTPPGPPSSSAR